MPTESLKVRCCIAGGGPAGMMAGLLLARAGVDVLVLEKHADFLRDFRGDTIHPSTLEVMHELGLLEQLLKLPHNRAPRLKADTGERNRTPELRKRHGWAWTRLFRRYEDYEAAMAELEGESGSGVDVAGPDELDLRHHAVR